MNRFDPRPRPRRRVFSAFTASALVILVLLAIAGHVVATRLSERSVTFTVKDKDRVCKGSGSDMTCEYLVFTDQGTFANKDSLVFGKFRSSDIQGDFEKGKQYSVDVAGWRVPFLSTYPNIVRVK